jgi:ABC-type glycerol-3-phosphate transport system permease component
MSEPAVLASPSAPGRSLTRRLTAAVTRLGIVLALSLIAAVAVYPIVFMGLSSFKTSLEYLMDPLAWPDGFSYVDNFVALYYRFNLPRLLLNTVTYIICAGAITLAVAVPASFTFAKARFPGRDGLRTAMIATLIMPPVTFLVPSYVMMANLDLIGTPIPVVLLWSATSVPGSIFLLSSLMRAIPSEVLEAARIDGAGYLETLLRIALPLSVPGIVTVMIFNITTWWNDLLIPLVYISQEEQKTVTAAAATIASRFNMDYPLVLSGLFLASVPPIAAYIVLQRYIRRGLVLGAVK